MQHTNASKTARLPGVIDTLSQGFAAAYRRPWLLAIPLVLDLVYWLGPRRSIQPLMQRLLAWADTVNPQTFNAEQRTAFLELAKQPWRLDLSPFGAVSPQLPKFINLLAPLLPELPSTPFATATWPITGAGALAGGWLLVNLVSMLVLSVFLMTLARPLRTDTAPRLDPRGLLRVYGSFLTILLIVGGAVLLVGIPALLLAVLLISVNTVAGQLLALVLQALLFWLLFTASFSFDAVVVNGAGPLRALLSSLLVVQRSFGSAFGLFMLGWLILWGMSFVWQPVAVTAAGLLAAMLGSAYLSMGLAAAHLVFFRDRIGRVGKR